MTRWLHERDAARMSGDVLAAVVRAHLVGQPVDLAAALAEYEAADTRCVDRQ